MRPTARPGRRTGPDRARRRQVLLVAGVLPALLALAFALKVGLMLQGNAAGRDAFDRGDNDGAAQEFAGTRSLNVIEPWVAPFDEGTGHHADGAWDDAIGAYEAALDDVPEREECTVRINLALVHEAVGDASAGQQDLDAARESWQEGIDVLAGGDCPIDAGRGEEQRADAAAVDERLREKLEQSEQQPEDPPPPEQQGEGPPQEPDGGEDPREERLERNNERGLDQRREDQELYEERDYSRPNSW